MYEHQGPLSQSLDPNLGLSAERYDGKIAKDPHR